MNFEFFLGGLGKGAGSRIWDKGEESNGLDRSFTVGSLGIDLVL